MSLASTKLNLRTSSRRMFWRAKPPDEFAVFHEAHHSRVAGVIYNMVGATPLEDLKQEALIKLWQGLPAFASKSDLKTWIYRVTTNVVLDHLRRRKIETVSLAEKFDSLERAAPAPGDLARETEHKDLIQSALSRLTAEQRIAVILFYFEGLTIEEIGKTLALPNGTVKSRLSVARDEMKQILAKMGVHHE